MSKSDISGGFCWWWGVQRRELTTPFDCEVWLYWALPIFILGYVVLALISLFSSPWHWRTIREDAIQAALSGPDPMPWYEHN